MNARAVYSNSEKMDNNKPKLAVKEAILETIAFFDVFSFPLTPLEVWRFLSVKCGFQEVAAELSCLVASRKAGMRQGFYYLPGKDELVEIRKRRYNFALAKIRKIRKFNLLFRLIPWISFVGIANVIGPNNMKEKSDIDLLVSTKKGRVWLTRFFCVTAMVFLRQRPDKKSVKDKVCLSFFVSEEFGSFEKLMIDAGKTGVGLAQHPDPYFLFWLACLYPVYEIGDSYRELIRSNPWLPQSLPNWFPFLVKTAGQEENYIYRDICDLAVGGLDCMLERLQKKIFPDKIAAAMNKDSRVVTGRGIIKLHSNDRRFQYLKEFWTRVSDLNRY